MSTTQVKSKEQSLNDFLDIVDTEGKILRLNPAQEFSTIQYSTGKGFRNIQEGSFYRPIHISELRKRLIQRLWHVGPFKYVDSSGQLCIIPSNPKTPIPTSEDIPSPENATVLNHQELFTDPEQDFTSWIENLPEGKGEYYLEILDKFYRMNKEIYFYDNSFRKINILDNAISVDVLKYDSDIYTNTLSITDLMSSSNSTSAKVDLGIQYVKNRNIFCHHTTFSYSPSEENWFEEVSGDVQVEYSEGCIRVCPISTDITECIISNCTLTYGNIGK